ncbi:MAG: hypothetical protein AB1758_00910 [Candidatus Eremiobacterota bacterium]
MLRVLVAILLLLAAPLEAQTLEETTRGIQAVTAPIVERYASRTDLSWGQRQAVDDLVRLRDACIQLSEALGQSPDADRLRPLVDRLLVARNRTRMTLPLLGLAPEELQTVEAALARAEAFDQAMRDLSGRFDGRDQPGGAALAQAPLSPVERPYYRDPQDLLLEARSIRFSAESLYTHCNRSYRSFTFSPFTSFDLLELARAARDFEFACSGSYANVQETEPYFRRLERAYYRVGYLPGGGFASFEAHNIERALDRLQRFYAAGR